MIDFRVKSCAEVWEEHMVYQNSRHKRRQFVRCYRSVLECTEAWVPGGRIIGFEDVTIVTTVPLTPGETWKLGTMSEANNARKRGMGPEATPQAEPEQEHSAPAEAQDPQGNPPPGRQKAVV